MIAANGVAAKRAWVWAGLLAALVLAVSMLAGVASHRAFADEATGYVSIAGVVGIDETAVFSTVPEAVEAIASCDATAQAADPAGAALVIHGTVSVDAQAVPNGSFDLVYPVDGSTCAIVGADGAACLVSTDSSGAGRTPVFSNGGGSLVVRGVTVQGPLGLSCRDSLVIDGSSFNAPISCSAGGVADVSGNVFASSGAPSAALYAELLGADSTLSFASNRVSGYAAGIAVSAQQGGPGVRLRVTSNTFALDAAAVGYDADGSYVVSLGNGPWAPSSVACDGNAVEGSLAFFMLANSCTIGVWGSDGLVATGVAAGDLNADAVVSLFELAGLGSADMQNFAPVTVGSSFAGTEVAAQVAAAAAILVPGSGEVEAAADENLPVSVTVTYDGNGATAGEVPAPVSVEGGQPVTVAHMGSLICAGCLFSGWNTAPDGSGVFYAAGQVIWPESDVVLYAQWTPNGTVGTVAVVDQYDEGRAA